MVLGAVVTLCQTVWGFLEAFMLMAAEPCDGLDGCGFSRNAGAPSPSWAAVATLLCRAAQLDSRPALRGS